MKRKDRPAGRAKITRAETTGQEDDRRGGR